MAIEIVDLHINSMVIFHSYVGNQRVHYIYSTSRHDQGMLYSAAEVLEIDLDLQKKRWRFP